MIRTDGRGFVDLLDASGADSTPMLACVRPSSTVTLAILPASAVDTTSLTGGRLDGVRATTGQPADVTYVTADAFEDAVVAAAANAERLATHLPPTRVLVVAVTTRRWRGRSRTTTMTVAGTLEDKAGNGKRLPQLVQPPAPSPAVPARPAASTRPTSGAPSTPPAAARGRSPANELRRTDERRRHGRKDRRREGQGRHVEERSRRQAGRQDGTVAERPAPQPTDREGRRGRRGRGRGHPSTQTANVA